MFMGKKPIGIIYNSSNRMAVIEEVKKCKGEGIPYIVIGAEPHMKFDFFNSPTAKNVEEAKKQFPNLFLKTPQLEKQEIDIKDYCIVVACRGAIAWDIIRRCEEVGIRRVIALKAKNDNTPWLSDFKGLVVDVDNYNEVEMIYEKVIKALNERKKTDPNWFGVSLEKMIWDPGYGFWAEKRDAIKFFQNEGMNVAAPSLHAFDEIGNKYKFRKFAEENGIPTLPYATGELEFNQDGSFDVKKAMKMAIEVVFKAKVISLSEEKSISTIEALKELLPEKLKKFAELGIERIVEEAVENNIPLFEKEELRKYPIRIKGSSEVGGGRSHYVVREWDKLIELIKLAYFDMKNILKIREPKLMMELNLDGARHIEINMVSYRDKEGRLIVKNLGWRDCSTQDRNQKMIEQGIHPEEYIPKIDRLKKEIEEEERKPKEEDVPEHLKSHLLEKGVIRSEEKLRELREKLKQYEREMHLLYGIEKVAEKIVIGTGIEGIYTLEFLADENQNFYVLEANLRKQVERDVSKVIMRINGNAFDFIDLFYHIVVGNDLGIKSVDWTGEVSIECRICALRINPNEDTLTPSLGKITKLNIPKCPEGVWVNLQNIESCFKDGKGEFNVPSFDPMIGTIIATGKTREEAVKKMENYLKDLEIEGIQTTIPLYLELFKLPEFRDKLCDTGVDCNFFKNWIQYKIAQMKYDEIEGKKGEIDKLKVDSWLHRLNLPPNISFSEFRKAIEER